MVIFQSYVGLPEGTVGDLIALPGEGLPSSGSGALRPARSLTAREEERARNMGSPGATHGVSQESKKHQHIVPFGDSM